MMIAGVGCSARPLDLQMVLLAVAVDPDRWDLVSPLGLLMVLLLVARRRLVSASQVDLLAVAVPTGSPILTL